MKERSKLICDFYLHKFKIYCRQLLSMKHLFNRFSLFLGIFEGMFFAVAPSSEWAGKAVPRQWREYFSPH